MKSDEYTDPRAQRLVAHAWLALGLAGLLVLMLAAMLLGSAGVIGWLEWTVTAAIAALAAVAETCALYAWRVEVRALDAWSVTPLTAPVRARSTSAPARRVGGVTRVEVPMSDRVRPDLLPRPAPTAGPAPAVASQSDRSETAAALAAAGEGGLS